MKIKYFQAGSSIPVKGTKLTVPSSLLMPKQVKQDNVNPVTPPAFIREFALASQNPEAKAMYDDIAIRSQVIGRRDAEALRLKVMPMNNGQRMFKSSQNEQYWLNEANKYGKFNNILEVIDWQKANGLVADGKFGLNSIAKWNALNPKPAPAAPATSATPYYTPFYPSDQSYIAAIQYANGQKPTGLIDNTTATLLRINRDINNQSRQNERDKKENLERLWDLYEYNAVNNALKNPNDYYGLPLSSLDNSWGWSNKYNLRGLDAANEKYLNELGVYNPAYALKRNALDLSVPSRKQGGQINYFQAGGQMQAQSQEQEAIAFAEDLLQNGIIKNELELQELALKNPKKLQQLFQIWKQSGIQGVKQAIQQQTQIAEKGAKLQFIKSLRGICPEGEELTYMKKGGVMCPVCKKKAEAKEKINKKEYFKKSSKKGEDGMKAPLAKCGKKVIAKCGCKAKK